MKVCTPLFLHFFVTRHSEGAHLEGRGESNLSNHSIELFFHNMVFTPWWLDAIAGLKAKNSTKSH